MRSGDKPALLSSELMDVLVAGGVLPAEEFGELLAEVIEEVKNRPLKELPQTRIMVWGCIIDDPVFFIDLLKKQAAKWYPMIRVSERGPGIRMYPIWKTPYEALNKHYLVHFQCPRTDRGGPAANALIMLWTWPGGIIKRMGNRLYHLFL